MSNNRLLITKATLTDGEVSVSGFKHLLVGVLCATVAFPEATVNIKNVPDIEETTVFKELLKCLNAKIIHQESSLLVSTQLLKNNELPTELTEKIHGAIYLLPVLLGRFKQVKLGKTGGCQIGSSSLTGQRPIEHMIDVLSQFGANFDIEQDSLVSSCQIFNSCTIDIMDYSDDPDIITGPFISGATKTAILAALFVQNGITTIKNPYTKPDVMELLKFIEQLGCHVIFNGKEIKISRNEASLRSEVYFSLFPDVSQVMTYITLAIYMNLNLRINSVTKEQLLSGMKSEFEVLDKIGIRYVFNNNSLQIPSHQTLKPVDIHVTSLSIYSDHQPFFALLLTQAQGNSSIEEKVWKSRFSYIVELTKLGYKFKQNLNKLIIFPSQQVCDAKLIALDLRAAAVLLIAALKCISSIELYGYEHLKRGYPNLIASLNALGAKIEVLNQDHLIYE